MDGADAHLINKLDIHAIRECLDTVVRERKVLLVSLRGALRARRGDRSTEIRHAKR